MPNGKSGKGKGAQVKRAPAKKVKELVDCAKCAGTGLADYQMGSAASKLCEECAGSGKVEVK